MLNSGAREAGMNWGIGCEKVYWHTLDIQSKLLFMRSCIWRVMIYVGGKVTGGGR
jgi:hypothetical protein